MELLSSLSDGNRPVDALARASPRTSHRRARAAGGQLAVLRAADPGRLDPRRHRRARLLVVRSLVPTATVVSGCPPGARASARAFLAPRAGRRRGRRPSPRPSGARPTTSSSPACSTTSAAWRWWWWPRRLRPVIATAHERDCPWSRPDERLRLRSRRRTAARPSAGTSPSTSARPWLPHRPDWRRRQAARQPSSTTPTPSPGPSTWTVPKTPRRCPISTRQPSTPWTSTSTLARVLAETQAGFDRCSLLLDDAAMDIQAYPLPSSLFPWPMPCSNGIALHRDGGAVCQQGLLAAHRLRPDDLAGAGFLGPVPPKSRPRRARAHQPRTTSPGRFAEGPRPYPPGRGALGRAEPPSEGSRASHHPSAASSTSPTASAPRKALRRVRADLEAEVAPHRRTPAGQGQPRDDIARREGAELELLKRYADSPSSTACSTKPSGSWCSRKAGLHRPARRRRRPRDQQPHRLRQFQHPQPEGLHHPPVPGARRLPRPPKAACRPPTRNHRQAKHAPFRLPARRHPELIRESAEGTEAGPARSSRTCARLLAHRRSQDWQAADLHLGLDSTLNIASNEIKVRADVVREYGTSRWSRCLPSQLNQVFMNLFVNAAQSIPGRAPRHHPACAPARGERRSGSRSRTTAAASRPDVLDRIFDPFFTTKPVGRAPASASLSYGIIQKHHGKITASSPGSGTLFASRYPCINRRPEPQNDSLRPSPPPPNRPHSPSSAWTTDPTSCRPCAACSAPRATP